MQFHPLESQILSAYAWVPGRADVARRDRIGMLALRFKSDGAEWWYREVPERVFEGLLMSASKGSYFHANIRGVYAEEVRPANG